MPFRFGDCALDADRRELRRGAQLVQVEPQVFDLLLYLLHNRDRVVSKDDVLANVWRGRTVSDSTLNNRINAARSVIGDSGEGQLLIRTISRRGFRFVGDVTEEALAAGDSGAAVEATTSARASTQEVQFCRAADGVNIAVATIGSGLPVVKTGTWMTHIEFDWQSPVWSPLLARLASQFRLIRYDPRGCGLSDRDPADISFEAFVGDLETVVDAVGLKRFALFGLSQGAAVSVAYAARHPERVSRLVLHGGFALGWRKRGDAAEAARHEALYTLIEHGWGQDNPAFRQVFTSRLVPGATGNEMQWFNDLQRISTTQANAVRVRKATSDIDVIQLLPRVAAPTVVLHSRDDGGVPFEQGCILAHGIPGARFVPLDSDNHLILSHEPAWQRYVSEICNFLAEDGSPAATAAASRLP